MAKNDLKLEDMDDIRTVILSAIEGLQNMESPHARANAYINADKLLSTVKPKCCQYT